MIPYGRGGAGFPTGMKWDFCGREKSEKKYVVCNADEGDSGAFSDRYLLEDQPLKVLFGMIACAYIIGSDEGVLYIRGEYPKSIEIINGTINELKKLNLLGKNILGTDFSCDLSICIGQGAYICGEETALLESLEGKKGQPRLKPPFPALIGLYGCPTIINNVETIAVVPTILRRGGKWFSSLGRAKNTGTKIYCISGNVNNPCNVEEEMGIPLKDLLEKHAGGVVIAPTKLTDFTPLYCVESGQGLVTQFDKNDVETAGLVKFDFLGLRTLTIIDWAVKMINEQLSADAKAIDINSLPLNDESVYRLLQKGETTAVFQLESRGMKELIKRLVPNCFDDIIALVALFRPGPLQSGMVDDFIDRKHGRTRVVYPHSDLEHVLANTYGVILYQEQVMQIAQVLASYTLGGADILRKAMGKKDPVEMAKQREAFMQGAVAKGIGENVAESIFDLMEKFAGYGFNKSHSAAYALVSYQTAWLKTHYPAFFMAAVLSADMQNTDKIVTLIEECRSMELVLVSPDVNVGQFNFTVNDQGEIVYGLGSIKGLGEGPVESILSAREGAPFSSLLDLCQRVDSQTVNKRTMEALIRSGALDNLTEGDCDHSRALLSVTLPEAMQAAEQSSRNQASGVEDLFGGIAPSERGVEPSLTGRRKFKPWAEQERLLAEKETLGLYLSGHPIDEFLPELSHITKDRLSDLRPERGTQVVAGLLHGFRTMKSKAGDTIAFLTLDDRSARFEVSLFAKEYEKYRELIQKDLILIVECTITVDDYNGSVRGRAKQVMTLGQARKKFAHRLALSLKSEGLETGFCEHLASMLAPYKKSSVEQGTSATIKSFPGPSETLESEQNQAQEGCSVVVNYQRPGSRGCIILGKDWIISPTDDLLQLLRMEYGKDQVELDYKQTKSLN